jgi:glyoxylase-like metal-dependent hydrolase (beta-lactamase superfamily II)
MRLDFARTRISRREALETTIAGAGGVAAAMLAGPRVTLAQQTQPPSPQSVAELTRIAEDVYMWRSMTHNTIFIVTDEGVVAADPVGLVNPRSPQMYKAAIAAVTDRPVRYLVYSHDHADHVTGGSVFMDTAVAVISHRLAGPKIAARNNALTPVPTYVFDTQASFTLGGKTIDLIHTGRNHSDNSLVIHYGARRLVFAVDFIPVRSLPFRTLDDSYLAEWLQSLQWIENNLFFDVLVPGHGRLGNKDTVREMHQYFLDLMDAIRAARSRGLADNSTEMVASVRSAMIPKYESWDNFGPYLPENIQGVIRMGREQGSF